MTLHVGSIMESTRESDTSPVSRLKHHTTTRHLLNGTQAQVKPELQDLSFVQLDKQIPSRASLKPFTRNMHLKSPTSKPQKIWTSKL